MTPVRLEPASPWSQVKHSTTEPLRSLLRKLPLAMEQLNVYAQLYNGVVDLNYGLSLHLLLYCRYVEAANLNRPQGYETFFMLNSSMKFQLVKGDSNPNNKYVLSERAL